MKKNIILGIIFSVFFITWMVFACKSENLSPNSTTTTIVLTSHESYCYRGLNIISNKVLVISSLLNDGSEKFDSVGVYETYIRCYLNDRCIMILPINGTRIDFIYDELTIKDLEKSK